MSQKIIQEARIISVAHFRVFFFFLDVKHLLNVYTVKQKDVFYEDRLASSELVCTDLFLHFGVLQNKVLTEMFWNFVYNTVQGIERYSVAGKMYAHFVRISLARRKSSYSP